MHTKIRDIAALFIFMGEGCHNSDINCKCIYFPPTWAGCNTKCMLKQSLMGLNSVFLLQDWLLYQSERIQSALFMNCWRETSSIHIFLKGISAIWNTNSLVQDLNSCLCAHFPKRVTITLHVPPIVDDEIGGGRGVFYYDVFWVKEMINLDI